MQFSGTGLAALVQACKQVVQSRPEDYEAAGAALVGVKQAGHSLQDVLQVWRNGTEPLLLCDEPSLLRRARNILGPSWLVQNWAVL